MLPAESSESAKFKKNVGKLITKPLTSLAWFVWSHFAWHFSR